MNLLTKMVEVIAGGGKHAFAGIAVQGSPLLGKIKMASSWAVPPSTRGILGPPQATNQALMHQLGSLFSGEGITCSTPERREHRLHGGRNGEQPRIAHGFAHQHQPHGRLIRLMARQAHRAPIRDIGNNRIPH